LTRALKEVTRTIAGYKRTITEQEKRIAEAVESAKPCTRPHYDDTPTTTLLDRANAKEQLAAYEDELDMLRRRDAEREAEMSRLRDLVRSISNGEVADGVSPPYHKPLLLKLTLCRH
jgi:hypothetical protein